MSADISYKVNAPLSAEEASELYRASTLAERRPSDDLAKMRQMLDCAHLVVTAWDGEQLVGIARTLTDFCFVAYLADLAVHQAYQRQGIGRELINQTKQALDPDCNIVLLAAPAAVEYYPRIGFSAHNSAWVLRAKEPLEQRS